MKRLYEVLALKYARASTNKRLYETPRYHDDFITTRKNIPERGLAVICRSTISMVI